MKKTWLELGQAGNLLGCDGLSWRFLGKTFPLSLILDGNEKSAVGKAGML